MNRNSDTIDTPEDLFNYDLDDNLRAKREAKAYDAGLEPCTHCGKGVAEGRGFIVILVNGGAHIARPGTSVYLNTSDSGYMGGWILGSTCAKKIPADFKEVF